MEIIDARNILVISDSHGAFEKFESILNKLEDVDFLIHLGDADGEEDYIRAVVPYPCRFVRGNMDFYSQAPDSDSFMIGNKRVFITHGHLYGVKSGLDDLAQLAKNNYDLVLYGHTHIKKFEKINDTLFLNPGSLKTSLLTGKKAYVMIRVDGDNNVEIVV